MKRSILDLDSILIKKYKQYLLPSILTSLALALNEFADYMIISNLLGEQAFATANLAAPLCLGIAACYMLLGSGGSGCYSVFLGRWEKQKAGSVFRLSVYLAWIFGIVYMAVGFIFRDALTNILCPDRSLVTYFSEYYVTVLLTAPFIVAMLTTIWFLPPSGAPVIATVVNIVSNVVNIIMDFVYMKGLDLGIRGSVLATFTGYVVGMLVMLVLLKKHNVRIANSPVGSDAATLFTKIFRLGASVALLQVCFAVRYSIGNQLAIRYAGQDGIIAFPLCLQTFSIASIFILGTADAAQPILAMLNGQMDHQGEAQVLKRSLFFQVIFGLGLVGVLELFPGVLVSLYRITGPDTIAMAIKGVRIFALTYITRGVCIQFMRFFLVARKTRYALLISLFDGLGVIPAGFILCEFF
ncbi:MAG: hypothetical protein K6G42_06280, partial [Lachnospiraceae bacterium]|nr:hypothetical protein [Lachnospiraceae bacterium]